MEKETLYGKLNKYSRDNYYPFHMPGHKRRTDIIYEGNKDEVGSIQNIEDLSPYVYDITEIDDFDNLHMPDGIIKERMDRVSEFYQSEKSFFLVNGSTCGILSAIGAACHNKNKIIMARNSHKSAYNGVFVNKLEALYIYPGIIEEYGLSGGINPDDIERLINKEGLSGDDIGAVYITSPTYEGVVSDIKSIGDICHKYNIPLIVDEAHGAHFSMHNKFPVSSLKLGADIVIQSLHKTLPALTQTAILHVKKDSLIDYKEIQRYLSIYQTSSPSYVLMASIDCCLDRLMNNNRFTAFEVFYKRIEDLRKKAEKFTNIKIMGKEIKGKNSVYDLDISKIVIFANSNIYSGDKLYKRMLEKYHLQMEMASLKYIIALTSVNDSEEGFDRLYNALFDIDREIRLYESHVNNGKVLISNKAMTPVICSKICDAVYREKENIVLESAEGRMSGEFIFLYPPGIPVIAPGEMFTKEIVEYLRECRYNGLNIIGMGNETREVVVVKESWNRLQTENFKRYRNGG